MQRSEHVLQGGWRVADPLNYLIVITDQERAVAEWPESYRRRLEDRLPAMKRLKKTGLSFDHAYTAACMCSPSRATLQTSNYPIVTGCTTTGTAILPPPSQTANIASVMGAAGYTCYWIGKWHLMGNKEPGSGSGDLSSWGYQAYGPPMPPDGVGWAWDPPDGGWMLDATYLGGGTRGPAATNRNDERYVRDAIAFLTSPPAAPWCLVVSLVNPHDVHIGWQESSGQVLSSVYYDPSHFSDHDVPIPTDSNQSLETMPRGQAYMTWDNACRIAPNISKQDYANYYAYLLRHVDHQIDSILDAVSDPDGTMIVRLADHGEMGLAHGLVEKSVNAYGQCTHIPLIFSNPVLWPTGKTTEAMASTVDLLPTLASLVGAHTTWNPPWTFVGLDLTPVLNDPTASVQDFVHFTYDDLSGTVNKQSIGPSVIRAIRSRYWLYAVYMDSVTSATTGYGDADWEMYDLSKDPEERHNIAGTEEQAQNQIILDWILQFMMAVKGTTPAWYSQHWPPTKTANSRGGPPASPFAPVNCPIGRLPGVSMTEAAHLVHVGIRDSAALLARCTTAAGRTSIAQALNVDDRRLETWIDGALRLRERPADLRTLR
jgi:arylsulfatase A-like enzyme